MALGVQKLQERSIEASGLILGALLDLIFEAHRGMEGTQKGFGGNLEDAILEKSIFE